MSQNDLESRKNNKQMHCSEEMVMSLAEFIINHFNQNKGFALCIPDKI